MPTAIQSRSNNLKKLAGYRDLQTHAAWDSYSPDQQRQMIDDDLAAGTRVPLLLVDLILTGFVPCALTVLAVSLPP